MLGEFVVKTSFYSTYIENRLPSSAANPYVLTAATVAAGIDGLVNRLELPSTQKKSWCRRCQKL